jgi:hypothetical protein
VIARGRGFTAFPNNLVKVGSVQQGCPGGSTIVSASLWGPLMTILLVRIQSIFRC